MNEVETARGPVGGSELGQVLMHEHVFLSDPEYSINFPGAVWSRERKIAEAIRTLRDMSALGVGTIVDVTVPGLGRDIGPVLEVAREVDINIVLATGFFVEDTLPLSIRMRGPGRRIDVPEPLKQMFVAEIRDGIAGTKAKAGIIKISSDKKGITPDIRRVFAAAAHAQAETGVAITTHSDAAGRGGLEQQEVLKSLGADLGRVVIGHSGDSTDLDYLTRLIDNGSYIGMDRFGFSQYLPTSERIATIVALVERGLADRMVLSHDANVYSDITPPEYRDLMRETIGYEWTFTMLHEQVLPALRAAGVSQQAIDQMLIHTPKTILERR